MIELFKILKYYSCRFLHAARSYICIVITMLVFVCIIIIICCWKRARGPKVHQKHEIKAVENKIISHGINNIMYLHNSNSNNNA